MKAISIVGAVCLLAVYVAWVVPYVRSDRVARAVAAAAAAEPPARTRLARQLPADGRRGRLGVRFGVVHRRARPRDRDARPLAGLRGLVIVAIAGNAVENVAGLVLADKGQSDLAISVVKNSVAQIAAFLFPLLVLVSLRSPPR